MEVVVGSVTALQAANSSPAMTPLPLQPTVRAQILLSKTSRATSPSRAAATRIKLQRLTATASYGATFLLNTSMTPMASPIVSQICWATPIKRKNQTALGGFMTVYNSTSQVEISGGPFKSPSAATMFTLLTLFCSFTFPWQLDEMRNYATGEIYFKLKLPANIITINWNFETPLSSRAP